MAWDRYHLRYRNEAKRMFYHAYNGYMAYAFPYDELRPLTCDGHDTWGSYSLTLVDALDTLAVMGNSTEFKKVVALISERTNFEADINVSVFETNIRIIGGLLSGHLLSQRMGVALEDGWPCSGPLLRLAEDVAMRLLPAFDSPTGMPYGTVNLKYGVPEGETPVSCSAGVGTFVVEFGTLSRLTGKSIYEEVSLRALHALWQRRSKLGLIGNHIDVVTGLWTGHDSGIGAGVDSFFEYLVKGSFLLQRPELMAIFNEARKSIDAHLRHEDWYLWKSMQRGQVTMAIFQSLEAFWPGILTLVGDIESAQKTLFNYHQVVKQYGFTPEFYNIPQAAAYIKRGGYPLRPEFVESLMYLFQATKDHTFLKMGADIVRAIEHSTKTKCGYATVENVADHSLENRMESFFLAETTKYLYLLFDEDHWLHADGQRGRPHIVGKRPCVIESGYFFNTEAHPIDVGSLACCSGPEISHLFLPSRDLAKLILDPSKLPKKKIGKPLPLKDNIKENVGTNGDGNADNSKKDEFLDLQSVVADEKVTEIDLGMVENEGELKEKIEDYIEKLNEMFGAIVNKNDQQNVAVHKHVLDSLSKDMLRKKLKVFSQVEKSPSGKHDANSPELIIQINKTLPLREDETGSNPGLRENSINTKEGLEESTEKPTWDPRFSSFNERSCDMKASHTPLAELSGTATSVSSSKFTSSVVSENKIIQKDPSSEKIPKKLFALSDFEERLLLDMGVLRNLSSFEMYDLLTCPIPTFIQTLSFKGQMVNVNP